MRVLMVSPELPWPANGGGLVRIASIQRGLGANAEVTLVAPVRRGEEERARELALATGTWVIGVPVSRLEVRLRRAAAPLAARPYHAAAYGFPEMRRRVADILEAERYDAVYVHMLYALEYLPRRMAAPLVLDPQNIDREYWTRKAEKAQGKLRRALMRRNLGLTVAYETRALSRVAAYVAVSERDAEIARGYIGASGARVLVVPNGVDAEAAAEFEVGAPAAGGELRVGFLGSMDLSINVNAARRMCLEIRPLVRDAMPGARIRWQVIGRNPTPAVQELARFDDVEVTGTVPDAGEYLRRLHVLVVPLDEGGGTKLRVLEAMGAGLPIIGSEYALQGIDGLEDGRNVRRAESPLAFASVIKALLQSPEERAQLGAAARRLAFERYDWKDITRRLASDLEDLIGDWKRSGAVTA